MHHAFKVPERPVVAIILARQGSKRLPNKNIQLLGGRTLIEWVVSAAKNSQVVDLTYVSTDSVDYMDIAVKAGAQAIMRPANLATDEATSESGVAHVLNMLSENLVKPDVAVLMQPTSPLTRPETIREAVAAVTEGGYDTAISVVKAAKKPFWALEKQVDRFTPFMVLPENSKYAGENPPDLYYPTGGVYAFRTQFFHSTGRVYGGRMHGILVSELEAIDIDDEVDLNYARFRVG